MNVKFSKDELSMVYQYAAATKQETLAGLREIVPVIRDRQAREIVESTIRKLDAIPEPECRRFIADTRQRFIQKRDNSIRRRLAEAKAQTREKTPHSKRTPGCLPGTAGRKDGNGKTQGQNRQQTAATGRKKSRKDLRRCRSRWSFHSEKIRAGTARCTLRCYPVAEPVAGKNPVTIGFSPL